MSSALFLLPPAAGMASEMPPWLQAHVGENEGQIAPTILQRARALHMRKTRAGAVSNPCYFAMDATRPHVSGSGAAGRRFYVICEGSRSFKAIPAGHGGGRHLKGSVNFANGRRCARNFSDARDSTLTTGGAYLTREIRTSFKGYYLNAARQYAPFLRSFIQFDGEGETGNARVREIGGHAAVLLRASCRRKDPSSAHADPEGYVPIGTLVDYSSGRSNGCTSWSLPDARALLAIIENKPTTLYIYPESRDIEAVARAAQNPSASRTRPYWNAACLKEIGTPKFWPRQNLEPIIARYKAGRPVVVHRPLPICQGWRAAARAVLRKTGLPRGASRRSR